MPHSIFVCVFYSPFPTVAESIQKELDEYRTSEEEVKRLKNVMVGHRVCKHYMKRYFVLPCTWKVILGEVSNRAKLLICWELILFSIGWSEQEYYFFPLNGKITYHRFPFSPLSQHFVRLCDNLLISIYPHGWRETMWM